MKDIRVGAEDAVASLDDVMGAIREIRGTNFARRESKRGRASIFDTVEGGNSRDGNTFLDLIAIGDDSAGGQNGSGGDMGDHQIGRMSESFANGAPGPFANTAENSPPPWTTKRAQQKKNKTVV
jgi:hypothetical protein